jgi:hypothetical protein
MSEVICRGRTTECEGCPHATIHEPENVTNEKGKLELCTQKGRCPDRGILTFCEKSKRLLRIRCVEAAKKVMGKAIQMCGKMSEFENRFGNIVRQCKEANVPVFIKQLNINGKAEKNMSKFPPDLQIREWPKETNVHE